MMGETMATKTATRREYPVEAQEAAFQAFVRRFPAYGATGRLDEVRAARDMDLAWRPVGS